MIVRRWFAVILFGVLSLATMRARAELRPLEAKLQAAFDQGQLTGLHNALVIHNGAVLAERHFAGIDRPWGGTWHTAKHGPKTLHGLRSITKSIIGLLYGIALAEGKVPGIAQSLIDQFPEHADLAHDPRRTAIRISDALSMRMGTQWHEELSYLDPNNSARGLSYAIDPVRYVLDRPMVAEPGQQLVYNSGAVTLIARLIERGTGMAIDKYAAQKLFEPLGIGSHQWARRADGTAVAFSGLRLTVHDLAKIGDLIQRKGSVGGRQIVPAAWLAASFTPRAVHSSGRAYGYLWWLVPQHWRGLPQLVLAYGNGGQMLAVHPQHKLIVVIFAGNYNDADQGKLPLKVMTEFVLPAVKLKPEN